MAARERVQDRAIWRTELLNQRFQQGDGFLRSVLSLYRRHHLDGLKVAEGCRAAIGRALKREQYQLCLPVHWEAEPQPILVPRHMRYRGDNRTKNLAFSPTYATLPA